MTTDHSERQDPGSAASGRDSSDDLLDALLQKAQWPEVTPQATRRLEQVVSVALQSMVPEVPDAFPKLARPSLRQSSYRWIVAATLIMIAFLAGHWVGIQSASSSSARDELASGKVDHIAGSDGQSANRTFPEQISNRTVDGVSGSPVQNQMADERTAAQMRSAATDQVVAETEKKKTETSAIQLSPPNALSNLPDAQAGNSMNTGTDALPTPLKPQEDEISHGRPIPRREQYKKQLEAVLACLAEQKEVDQGCVLPLMSKRAEFEYLLWEVIRNSTGQQRLTALTAVGLIGSERSVPMLMKSSAEQDLRSASLSALKRCASEKTLAAFVIQRQDERLAYEFAAELAHRPSHRAYQTWIHLVQNRDARTTCLQAANELRAELVDLMFSTMDAPLVADRVAAAISLGARTDAATRERLAALVKNYPLRWEPVAALMWNASPEAMHVLSLLQNDPQRIAVLQTASIQLSAYTGVTPGNR